MESKDEKIYLWKRDPIHIHLTQTLELISLLEKFIMLLMRMENSFISTKTSF